MPNSHSAARSAAVVFAFSALTAACTLPGSGTGLADTHWSLAAIDGRPTAAPASLLVKDGHATGNTGCNPFSGSAKISGHDIVFGPMITTKMACLPQARMDQEATLLAAFAAAAHWRIDNGDLVLSDSQANDRLRFSPP